MPETSLFVIDIQKDLAGDIGTDIPAADRVRGAAEELLSNARQHIDRSNSARDDSSIEIVFVQHEEDAASGNLVRGSKPWELVYTPDANSAYEHLVSKATRDTFTSNPSLASDLRSRGVKNIIAFGIQSECCVLGTCRGAVAAGFQVTLLSGAHSTYDIPNGRTAAQIEKDVEKLLSDSGVLVRSWQQWLATLMSDKDS